MTLKEKFNSTIPIEFKGIYKPLLNDCEKVADDFAIGFAEWYEFMLRQTDNLTKRFSKTEILEIYKKEKGL